MAQKRIGHGVALLSALCTLHSAAHPASGKYTLNVVPSFSWLSTRIVPRCSCTIWYESASPSPTPRSLVVKKGVKMSCKMLLLDPGPGVAHLCTTMSWYFLPSDCTVVNRSDMRVMTVSFPPLGMASTAFLMMFKNT